MNEDLLLEVLKRKMQRDLGINCCQYKASYIKRRIQVRMRATGSANYGDYLRVLKNEPDEYHSLLDDLTINVTGFFRDKDVYMMLKDELIPRIFEFKRNKKIYGIRVWSAGCSTGEEAYSVAICFNENLRKMKDSLLWNVKIYGTDLDTECLKKARQAFYPAVEALEGLDVKRYFIKEEEGYRVCGEIRQMVKFERADIMLENQKKYIDLLLCRNTLIYFTKESQTEILKNFYTSLRRGGYLVLGKSETLLGASLMGLVPVHRKERVYRKNDEI